MGPGVNEVLTGVFGDEESERVLVEIRVPEVEAAEANNGGGDDFGRGGAAGAFLLLDFSGWGDVMVFSSVVLSSNTLERAFSGPAFCLRA